MIWIDDPDDPRVGEYRRLRGRESDEVLWAEGPTVVERLLSSSLRTRSVLLSTAAFERLGTMVAQSAGDNIGVYVAEQSVVNAIVDFELHRGAIAVADRPALSSVESTLDSARVVLVLEGVNDTTNLGAIARSARALGADAMLLDSTCADPYYRRSVRVSMGEMFHLRIARAPLDQLFGGLDSAGFTVWALTPRPEATPIGEAARRGVPSRLALMFGAEGPGLSQAVLARAINVRVPQRDDVDSLNVGHAVAAALAVVASSAP